MTDLDQNSYSPEILIVEDSPDQLERLSAVMATAGYRLRAAVDGKQALLLLQDELPDLIMLDVGLPGMDGYEVCQRLKADKATADIPVIFLSGMQEVGDIARAFEVQAVDYIVKPFKQAEVLSRVKTHLELRALRQGLEDMCYIRTRQLQQEVTERRLAEAELLESRQQLRRLSGHMEEVREVERAHIAREIHDELGQSLSVARIDLARLKSHLADPREKLEKHIGNILEVLEQAANMARSISENLRPGMLDLIGLGPAIEHHIKRFSEMTGVECALNMGNKGDFFVDDRVAIATFRILQEALNNVARHAEATKVTIHLVELGAEIMLIVQDDGKGMAPYTDDDGKSHFGLLGMNERARLLGGHVLIDSAPGKGTRIEASLPVEPGACS